MADTKYCEECERRATIPGYSFTFHDCPNATKEKQAPSKDEPPPNESGEQK